MFTSKMMSWLLLLNVAKVKKKRAKRKIDGFRKTDDSRIWNSRVSRARSQIKIGNIFVKEKLLEEYSVKIYKIHPYFCEHYEEKMQVDKNGYKYILFRIDVYFTEYLLTIEIDEKKHVRKDLIFEEKRQEVLENKLGCRFLRINTSK